MTQFSEPEWIHTGRDDASAAEDSTLESTRSCIPTGGSVDIGTEENILGPQQNTVEAGTEEDSEIQYVVCVFRILWHKCCP